MRAGGAPSRQRQLRGVPDAETANPGKPSMRPHFVKARVKVHLPSRRLARRLSWPAMHRPLRRERPDPGKPQNAAQIRSAASSVDMWTTLLPRPHAHRENRNQKQRTNHALPKPDNLIRYRQAHRDWRLVYPPSRHEDWSYRQDDMPTTKRSLNDPTGERPTGLTTLAFFAGKKQSSCHCHLPGLSRGRPCSQSPFLIAASTT